MAVYFIREGSDGPVKIGYAANVERRRRGMQTSHAVDLVVLRIIEGGRDIEEWMHERFSEHRIRGEWFNFDPLMLEIESPLAALDATRGSLDPEAAADEPPPTMRRRETEFDRKVREKMHAYIWSQIERLEDEFADIAVQVAIMETREKAK